MNLYRRLMPIVGVACLGLGALALSHLGGCTSAPTPEPASTPTDQSRDRDLTTLRLLYSRSPVTLNPHLATGSQDFEATRIVYEPLASYDANGDLVPILAAEIPTQENGGLAADGKSVTWKLRSGVTWSDGKPLTADDVVFTFELVTNPEVAAATAQYYRTVESVEAIDPQTVKISFKAPTPAWAEPFTGQTGTILPRHVFADFNNAKAREAPANLQPVGTGPYKVVGFGQGSVLYEPNEKYRGEAPSFKRIELVGGIAPYAAARDVLKTGAADFAHSLQVEAAALEELQQAGQGQVQITFGSYVERIMLNWTNPYLATETGERSSMQFPHPFLSDVQVRQAINLAIDRDAIATELYGATGKPTAQLLVAPDDYVSSAIGYDYSPERAKILLDRAGWVDTNGDGTRDKDGVEMKVVFQTSVNTVRQTTQQMVKDDLSDIGIKVEIKRVRVDDFFSADPQQTNSINLFYADMQEYNTGNDSPDPGTYMSWWLCDQIAAQINDWQKPNNARYCNPEYDKLWQAAAQELDAQRRADLFKQMDELLARDVAVIPIVHRAAANGVINSLTGLKPTPWDTSTWDIGNWQRVEPPAEATETQ